MRAALLLVALVLLAGCVRPTDEPQAADGEQPAALAEPLDATNASSAPTTGSLAVLAVFSDKTPLPGVKIELANTSAQTDAQGIARFDALAPGSYTLVASKTAHRTAQQTVEIVAGVDAQTEVVLAAEEGGQHSHAVGFAAHTDTYVFDGHFDCTAVYLIIPGDCMLLVDNATETAGVEDPASNVTTEKYLIDFPLDVNWSKLVVEMTWTEPTPPTSDGMTLALEPAESPPDGHSAKYARTDGKAPLRLELLPGVKHETATEEDMPNPQGGEVIRARAFVRGYGHDAGELGFLGVGAATDFKFTLTVSIFYG